MDIAMIAPTPLPTSIFSPVTAIGAVQRLFPSKVEEILTGFSKSYHLTSR